MAERKGSMTEFPANGRMVSGFLARPEASGAPGVIVIQEWWGLVGHIMDVCERLAAEGYVALAPDLYYGRQTEEPDEARKLAMELDRQRVIVDLEAAAAYLRSLGCPSVGAIGFCLGGGMVWELAARPGVIDAAAPFYGRALPAERAGEVTVPVMGFYGAEDQGIPVEPVRATEQALCDQGKEATIYVYDGAGHAFFNDDRPSGYHKGAAEDAWEHVTEFFQRTLKRAETVGGVVGSWS